MITESFRVGPFSDLKLIDSFKSVKASESGATSLFLKGLADSPAAPADHYFTPTLHNGFGSSPADPVGSDLYAIDIQVWLLWLFLLFSGMFGMGFSLSFVGKGDELFSLG